jgi:predicted metal-dependent hydrolase
MATLRSSSTPPVPEGRGVHPEGLAAPFLAGGRTDGPELLGQVEPAVPAEGAPAVEIRPSSRRRKTASAFYEAGRIVVLVPARMPLSDRDAVARRLVDRLLKRSSRTVRTDHELERRALELSGRYLGGVAPASIRWVGNQERRWASCTPSTGQIRVSTRLQLVPSWVLDAVLVHELAHLLEASHSSRFHELAARYPRRAEADAYLEGFSLGRATGGPSGPGAQAGDEMLSDDVDHGLAECGAGSATLDG